MKKVFTYLTVMLITISNISAKKRDILPYKNKNLSTEERVNDLISRMTLEEKVGQLCSQFDGYSAADIQGEMDSLYLFKGILPGVLQTNQHNFKETLVTRNAIQEHIQKNTRLGIPLIYVEESLHGLAKESATSFPQAIALGSTWNQELIEKVFSLAALETRSRGGHLVLSPVADVTLDPRWGRVEECYGEDPYHAGVMASAAVKGFQGTNDEIVAPGHVAATLKHFVGHGAREGGRNKAPANFSERNLREIQAKPFIMAVKNAMPYCIMPSYNEVDAVPMYINKKLLVDYMRGTGGFKGMYVSDYWALGELIGFHSVVSSPKEAAIQAFNAGVEFDYPDGGIFRYLVEACREGTVSEEAINSAVRKILTLKFDLGLFENPYINVKEAERISKLQSSRDLARKAAEESIILLKNNNSTLPLDKEAIKTIAVVGPNATSCRLGEYSGTPNQKVSILEGIKKYVGDDVNVIYSKGCDITTSVTENSKDSWFMSQVTFPTKEENFALINKAVEDVKPADVIILVIGENEQICREAWAWEQLGDNSTLKLQSWQQDLFDAMKASGKPVVVCLNHGRQLEINEISETADAILDLWYAGQETGNAVANILFGEINPSGKLTVTYPKSVGQLPVHYNRKKNSARNYVSEKFGWIYPFGHGLSYTKFEYSKLVLSSNEIAIGDSVSVIDNVKNTENFDGSEVCT